jgi:hypothetical protein
MTGNVFALPAAMTKVVNQKCVLSLICFQMIAVIILHAIESGGGRVGLICIVLTLIRMAGGVYDSQNFEQVPQPLK